MKTKNATVSAILRVLKAAALVAVTLLCAAIVMAFHTAKGACAGLAEGFRTVRGRVGKTVGEAKAEVLA